MIASATRNATSKLGLAATLSALILCGPTVVPAAAEPSYGLSTFGDLKLPADFKNFPYVNPDAPKGGRLALIGTASKDTYDSFNDFILKGDSAQGLGFLYDSLMTPCLDEPDALYGLVAEWADVAEDKHSVVFKLRSEAKFADGTPITPEDLVFTFETLKEKGHPRFRITLRDVTKAEVVAPDKVRYTFTGTLVRDLPLEVAKLPVLPKVYYATHNFEETTLDRPLGSGPYKIGDFRSGTFVSYKRREDYWGKDLPVNRGRFNFDELRYEYYRDRNIGLENLLRGTFDLREEFTSVHWATAYNVAAVKDGRIIRLTLPDDRPSGAQGFFTNLRREKFQDPRLRKALDMTFDFEWSNNNLFFGLYKRTTSYFENSEMKATGLPTPEELALLEPYRDKLPAAVFGEPYTPPVTDASGQDRKLLRQAATLLDEAGWLVKDGRRVNAKGEQLDIEFLLDDTLFERILGPYVENLKRLGINAYTRVIDPAQYERRLKSFEFDVIVQRFSMDLTPGIELKNFWGSGSARTEGSYNLAGISDPVVDALVEKVISAKSRTELVAATRAIDRVMRAGHYWVPQWYKAAHNIAYWDKYSYPATKPKYDPGILDTWWYDTAKAAKLKVN